MLWDWEFDDDFIRLLLAGAHQRRLSARAFRAVELSTFARLAESSSVSSPMIIDRASDVHFFLIPALTRLRNQGAALINDPEQMIWCRDKATMHLELVQRGLPVPHGIILSQQDDVESVISSVKTKLGSPFVIKPAEGGGGEGVQLAAYTPQDIRQALQESKCKKIILQNRITPKQIGSQRAWFRVFFLLGEVIPCWWDDVTHLYSLAAVPDSLQTRMQELVRTIAQISRMQFFSTEIACTEDDQLLIIDFVNEMCDMRLQSRHPDGVPDALVRHITDRLLDSIPGI